MAKKTARHLSDKEIEIVCEWIKSQTYKPKWDEAVSIIRDLFGIERTLQSVMKNAAFKVAMAARKKVALKRPTIGKPTTKKIENLEQEIDRLRVEIEELKSMNELLVQERIEIINFLKSRRIPEDQFKRVLAPINRNSSRR